MIAAPAAAARDQMLGARPATGSLAGLCGGSGRSRREPGDQKLARMLADTTLSSYSTLETLEVRLVRRASRFTRMVREYS